MHFKSSEIFLQQMLNHILVASFHLLPILFVFFVFPTHILVLPCHLGQQLPISKKKSHNSSQKPEAKKVFCLIEFQE